MKKNEFILSLKNIKKTYTFKGKSNKVLDNINLDLNYGDFITIQGKSGSGKSTILNIISGIINADEGKVILEGKDMNKRFDPTIPYHRGKLIGFVFQSFNLLNYQNVFENVRSPLYFHSEAGLSHKKSVINALNAVGLGEKIYHYPNILSGGQMQRVAIARAIVKKPKLIIADEPTGNLDEETTNEILSIFLKLNKEQNITFIVVTHDEEFMPYANKKFLLKDKNLHRL